jgi:ABC-type sugar transport system permease subunit
MTENKRRTTNYLLTGNTEGNRTTRIAGEVIGRAIERDGGRITGRVVAAVLVVLGVVGLAFVAYRLLMLDLILNLVGEQG